MANFNFSNRKLNGRIKVTSLDPSHGRACDADYNFAFTHKFRGLIETDLKENEPDNNLPDRWVPEHF